MSSDTCWRKSSYSGGQGGNCVEVGTAAPIVAVRDTKDRQGPALTFSAEAWRRFASQLRSERSLDLSQRLLEPTWSGWSSDTDQQRHVGAQSADYMEPQPGSTRATQLLLWTM